MERRGKRRQERRIARWAAQGRRAARWCPGRTTAAWAAIIRRLRPWQPVVIVDANRRRARRVRRVLIRTTREQFKALGVAPPQHLLIVVQRIVRRERPEASLLQIFDGRDGMRRHVLYLALRVGEDSMSVGAITATLRQQLYEVMGDALVAVAPATTEAQSRPASVVAFRPPVQEPPPFDDDDAPPLDDSWAPVDGGVLAAAEG